MIRAIPLGLAAALAASAAHAEGGRIRSGEHAGFSRIVMVIDPTTEWSLETAPGRATIFFPGRELAFGTASVFEKIPRSRITDVETAATPEGTVVGVDIACDCRVSASFVGATYLALDVADRDLVRPAMSPSEEPAIKEPEVPEETAEARAERETEVVANAEAALLAQIERAASQGLIELDTEDDVATPEPAEPIALTSPRPAPGTPQPPVRPALPVRAQRPEIEAPQPPSDPGSPLAVLLEHDQIEAITVFDRDRRSVSERLQQSAVPIECLPDTRLDVGSWSNGRTLFEQRPRLASRLVGEFDRPDTEALATLTKLYIRFGFGREAEQALESFDASLEDGPLLRDLARAIEGRPAATDGPLALAAPCPSNHGLWLALGDVAPAFHDPAHFSTVQVAFADLPPDLRVLVGPALVGRLLDAGQADAARLIHDTAVRPGQRPSPDMRLAAARLAAAEGDPDLAIRELGALVEENASNASTALVYLVELAREARLEIPERTILDLRAAIVQNRGTSLEAVLRARLVAALASAAELSEAVAELRSARSVFPKEPEFDGLAEAILGEAQPERVGNGTYAEVILSARDMLDTTPATDRARQAIAQHLIEVGLPQAAVEIVMPAAARDDAARLVLAQALVRMGEPARAERVLTGLEGDEAAETRARALALGGDFAEANAALLGSDTGEAAMPFAWPAGDWPRARFAAPLPEQRALADYMASRTDPRTTRTASNDPEALAPVEAVIEPLPSLERPSLTSARRLLATSRQIGDFVQTVLTGDPAPDPE